MAKKSETKKLTLKRESLRELTAAEMQHVAGGLTRTCSCRTAY